MKNSAKRLFFTILTAVVFLVIYTAIMYLVGGRHTEDLIVKHNQRKTESVRSILNQLDETAF